ncbi:unnamed protein product [Rhizoctonia solani]|uniref:DNAJ-containing protein X-domain domain-containing protein n=1 Tax=Rhizoctonia solani TaxID=456999 RepID=A0A8H3A9U5_9AGAM|nr:unnamed protein product [Rhizoctonia solani]
MFKVEAKSVFVLRDTTYADSLPRSELKGESYGVGLSNAVRFVYVAKAKHYLATKKTFMGMGGSLHNVWRNVCVQISWLITWLTVLSIAPEPKQVFHQIAEAEKSSMSPEE